MTALAAARPARAFPVLRSLRGPALDQTLDLEPHLEAAEQMTPVVRDHGTAVFRLRGTDLDCGSLGCEATTAGYRVELLPECTRLGDDVLVGLRIYRLASSRSQGCEIRFRAGTSRVHATVMIRSER